MTGRRYYANTYGGFNSATKEQLDALPGSEAGSIANAHINGDLYFSASSSVSSRLAALEAKVNGTS